MAGDLDLDPDRVLGGGTMDLLACSECERRFYASAVGPFDGRFLWGPLMAAFARNAEAA
jgi:hypothetical protein